MPTSWTLRPHPGFQNQRGPVVLVIMDGVGIGRGDQADAVAQAKTPTLDLLRDEGLHREILAHGKAVGMPSDGDMGNSEVGHNAMGAGKIYGQGAVRVNDALADGSLFTGETWRWLIEPCVAEDRALHLIGLLSDGNVHAHIDHLIALLQEAARAGVHRVFVHPLLDGRDVGQTSALRYILQLETELAALCEEGRNYAIASGGGRMKVTMDRYGANWPVVARGWKAHVLGKGRPFQSAQQAVETMRLEQPGIIDQDLGEFVVVENGRPVGTIQDGDAVININFRGDRALELTMAFEQRDFPHFERERLPKVRYAGMMQYDGDLLLPNRYLVTPPAIADTMGEYLARNGIPQYAISETQKYGHVTYFWNGNRSSKFDAKSETYCEVPSDRISFDQAPAMKAAEITQKMLEAVRSGRWRFLRLNYANGDMVGHTGVLAATIQAIEAVDEGLAQLKTAVAELGGILVVTADHGNADEMIMRGKDGELERGSKGELIPKTSHTLNPVPFVVYDPQNRGRYSLRRDLPEAGLANIAATLLNLLGYEAPEEYEASMLNFSK